MAQNIRPVRLWKVPWIYPPVCIQSNPFSTPWRVVGGCIYSSCSSQEMSRYMHHVRNIVKKQTRETSCKIHVVFWASQAVHTHKKVYPWSWKRELLQSGAGAFVPWSGGDAALEKRATKPQHHASARVTSLLAVREREALQRHKSSINQKCRERERMDTTITNSYDTNARFPMCSLWWGSPAPTQEHACMSLALYISLSLSRFSFLLIKSKRWSDPNLQSPSLHAHFTAFVYMSPLASNTFG